MPNIGDTVRYGQSGLCRLEGKCQKEIAGETLEYYVLAPLFKAGSTVFVPCANEELVARMCPPLKTEEIENLLKTAADAETEWIRDFRRRSDFSKKALASNDRMDALLLIKTIYNHRKEAQGKGVRVHTTDDYFLKDAETLIYSEFSYVMGQEYAQVEQEIRALFGAE